jgi:hypothetical protein
MAPSKPSTSKSKSSTSKSNKDTKSKSNKDTSTSKDKGNHQIPTPDPTPVVPAVPTVEDFVNPRVAENVRREAECRQACLGFTMIDFKADMWEFGRWNNRELNRANVQKIKENLRTSVKNKKLDTAVRLIVHESEIDPDCLIQEKDLGGPIPALQFIGVSPKRLTLASGHHRWNALMEYIKEIDDKIGSRPFRAWQTRTGHYRSTRMGNQGKRYAKGTHGSTQVDWTMVGCCILGRSVVNLI